MWHTGVPHFLTYDLTHLLRNYIFKNYLGDNINYPINLFRLINQGINLFNIENFNFDQVLQKYNKDEYIVSIFIKSKNNLKVLSKIKFKEQFSIINSSFEYEETLSAADKIINNLKISFENEWKKVNRINQSIKLPLDFLAKLRVKFERKTFTGPFVPIVVPLDIKFIQSAF